MSACNCVILWQSTLAECDAALPLAPGPVPRVLLRTEGIGKRNGRPGPDIACHCCPFCGVRYSETQRWEPVLVNTNGQVMG